jgi:hypothetical protein
MNARIADPLSMKDRDRSLGQTIAASDAVAIRANTEPGTDFGRPEASDRGCGVC